MFDLFEFIDMYPESLTRVIELRFAALSNIAGFRIAPLGEVLVEGIWPVGFTGLFESSWSREWDWSGKLSTWMVRTWASDS